MKNVQLHVTGKEATIAYCVRYICLAAVAIAFLNPKRGRTKIEISKPAKNEQNTQSALLADGEPIEEAEEESK